MTDNNGKALREAKAWMEIVRNAGYTPTQEGRMLIELVEAVEAAPVADIADDGKHNGESALLSAAIKAGYYTGQRVRVLAVGEDG